MTTAEGHPLLRVPNPSDIEQIARVHIQGWREAYGSLLPPQFYDGDALRRRIAMWTRILAEIEHHPRLRVSEVTGEIVGFALAGPPDGDDPARDLELSMIYISAEHYGTGIGQALLDAVLDHSPAQLWVAAENPRAQAFYHRNGFRLDGRSHILDEIAGMSEVRMVR